MPNPLSESLGRIVRRVLRTQSCRTSFETRVLNMARQLADGHRGEFTRDTLAKLVVEQLMASRQRTPQLLGVANAGSAHFGTHAQMPDSTFAL